MNYPGVAAEMLCAYRQWAMYEPEQLRNLQVILDRLARVGLLTGQPDETLEAEDVLVEVCGVTRFGGMQRADLGRTHGDDPRQPVRLRVFVHGCVAASGRMPGAVRLLRPFWLALLCPEFMTEFLSDASVSSLAERLCMAAIA